jgi:hypothetical protein
VKAFLRKRALPLIAVLAIAAVAAGVTAFLASASSGSASISAQSNMAALSSNSTTVPNSALPSTISTLPDGYAPADGAAHLLLSQGGVAQYAWTNGSQVCHTDTNGNGGCLASFPSSGVDWVIANPGSLGSTPMYVDGLVSDNVRAVSVVVNGNAEPATISNNALYYKLSNASFGPSDIKSLVVTFADGSQQTIDCSAPNPSSITKVNKPSG